MLWAKKVNMMHYFFMALFCQYNVDSLKPTQLFRQYSKKYVRYLKTTVLSCQLFQNFHENPPAVMHIFVPTNEISVKTTLYYGQKSQ